MKFYLFNIRPKLHHQKWRKLRVTLPVNMHALFSVCSLRDDNVITSKPTWKLKHRNCILEYFEYFSAKCHQNRSVLFWTIQFQSWCIFLRHSAYTPFSFKWWLILIKDINATYFFTRWIKHASSKLPSIRPLLLLTPLSFFPLSTLNYLQQFDHCPGTVKFPDISLSLRHFFPRWEDWHHCDKVKVKLGYTVVRSKAELNLARLITITTRAPKTPFLYPFLGAELMYNNKI